ncbi:LURP-one-related/scramblase family protein [Nocardiopsis aegyptia]|uniref:Scramblase n=1 Tax=Nocardiopsis aegyptia TaxID=220378 RepID=A0A7Z0JBY7_9ACTN|nr:scramblase [Nocardiopsis aegyptia]NYJ35970.1 hypothetical protein [Nocardiopsis aegyptia]
MDLFTADPLLTVQPGVQPGTEAEYYFLNGHGQQVARAYEENVSAGMSVARFVASAMVPRKVLIDDMHRRPLLAIEKRTFGGTTSVTWPDGRPVGTIENESKFSGAGFALLDPWERRLGSAKGDFVLNSDFVVRDDADHEVARVNRTRSPHGGLGDAYLLRRRYPTLPEPLNTLLVASGIVIDLVVHSDS